VVVDVLVDVLVDAGVSAWRRVWDAGGMPPMLLAMDIPDKVSLQ
jgi:hypothetical protein